MGLFGSKKKSNDDDAMRRLAAELGLTYCGTDRDKTYRATHGAFPDLPLLRSGNKRAVSHLMYGDINGVDVRIFNFDVAAKTTDEFRAHRSCVLLTSDTAFPEVFFSPRDRLPRLSESHTAGGINLGSLELLERWRIQAKSQEDVRGLVDDETEQWLLRCPIERLRLEIKDDAILGHVPDLPGADEFKPLLQTMSAFRSAVRPEAWDTYRR